MEIKDCHKRLKRFYGDVAFCQNRDIVGLVTGKKVLDIGCGYGSLISHIKNERPDLDVVGIDPDPQSRKMAKELYDIDVIDMSVYDLKFPDNSFTTVILRDAVHHFETKDELVKALKEIRRVSSNELIIFDPNPNWILKISRKFINHKDPEAPYEYVREELEKAGFKIKSTSLRDVIAFPLSGGFVGIELIPNNKVIKNFVIALDKALNTLFKVLKLQKFFCWRYIIHAVK